MIHDQKEKSKQKMNGNGGDGSWFFGQIIVIL